MMETDVIVVGAGIAGASVAAHLAASCRVVLLEAEEQPGYHATSRSAALFSEVYGGELVRCLSRASRDFFQAPPSGVFDAPLMRRRGTMFIATRDQEMQLQSFSSLPDLASEITLIGANEAIGLCPVLRPDLIAGAVFEPNSADIDVHALHQGYLRWFRRAGGTMMTGHRVEALSWRVNKWVAEACGKNFAAPILVNAAGAWADQIAQLGVVGLSGLTPKRRTAVIIDPPDGVAVACWPAVIDIGEQFYFKPDAGRLLLSPADETPSAPCDAQADDWDVALAIDRVQKVTTLTPNRVKHRWAGLRSFVADREPIAGFDVQAPGFFWLAGQGGYGIQTAPALAQFAASIILGSASTAGDSSSSIVATRLSPQRLRSPDNARARLPAILAGMNDFSLARPI